MRCGISNSDHVVSNQAFHRGKDKNKFKCSSALRATLIKFQTAKALCVQREKNTVMKIKNQKFKNQSKQENQYVSLQGNLVHNSYFNKTIDVFQKKYQSIIQNKQKQALKNYISNIKKQNQQKKLAQTLSKQKLSQIKHISQQRTQKRPKITQSLSQPNRTFHSPKKNQKSYTKYSFFKILSNKHFSIQNQNIIQGSQSKINQNDKNVIQKQNQTTENKKQKDQQLQHKVYQKRSILKSYTNKKRLFFNRQNKRSKTEQKDIQHQLIICDPVEDNNEKHQAIRDELKNLFELQKNKLSILQKKKKNIQEIQEKFNSNSVLYNFQRTKTLNFQNPKTDNKKLIKHISLKLIERQKTVQLIRTKKNKKLVNQQKNNQDLSITTTKFPQNQHKTKYITSKSFKAKISKIRVRLGSSVYSKNITQQCQGTSSQNNKFNTITSSEDIKFLNSKNYKISNYRRSPNSFFYQNKIEEAQQAFIQKRRLLPTATIQSKSMVLSQKRHLYTTLDKFKDKKQRNNQLQTQQAFYQNYCRGQNRVIGWQINNQEINLQNNQIQQFY